MKALMLVDAQVNMLTGDWALPEAEKAVALLGEKLQQAHEAGVQVIQVLNAIEEGWPEELFDPYFAPTDSDIVIWKDTPSVFESNPQFAETLRSIGVSELEVIGMQSDLCLRASALDALKLGFEVTVARATHFTYGNENQTHTEISDAMQDEMVAAGIKPE